MKPDFLPEPPPAASTQLGLVQNPPLILLIDDNPDSIRLLSGLVRDMATVIFATGGEAGLELARLRRPDLILLDVEMPGITGYDVCRALKQDPVTRSASVIIVTSHQSSFHEVSAFEAGAVDFLSKPLVPAVVQARVQTHLTLKRQSDTLQRMALLDGLTGIFNRSHLNEQLELEWRRHLRHQFTLGFVLVDIDHFKAFNDHYGHQEGDRCLREVAQVLAASCRRPGEFVARYGGEEFAIVLPNIKPAELVGFGEWICQQVRDQRIEHKQSATSAVVTISVGLSCLVPSGASSQEQLLSRADQALYQAKNEGRNRAKVASSPV